MKSNGELFLEDELGELIIWFKNKYPDWKIVVDHYYNKDETREEVVVYISNDELQIYKASATYLTDEMKEDTFYLSKLKEAFLPKKQRTIEEAISGKVPS